MSLSISDCILEIIFERCHAQLKMLVKQELCVHVTEILSRIILRIIHADTGMIQSNLSPTIENLPNLLVLNII